MEKLAEKAKNLWREHQKFLLPALIAVPVLAAFCLQFYQTRPKFQDLTVELGTESVSKSQFFTKYAWPSRTAFVSDVSEIDLNTVGQTELTLRQGKAEETVTLTVQDTCPPTGTFLTHVVRNADYVPNAQDFITDLSDLAETRVYFDPEPEPRTDYDDVTLTVAAEDASGNAIRQECTLSCEWLKKSYVHELGTGLKADDLLLVPGTGRELLNQEYLDRFRTFPEGDYPILSTSGSKVVSCMVHIEDHAGPDLQLQEVVIDPWETAEMEDFIVSAEDASGDVELRLITELDFDTLEPQTVTIEAEDIYGNITSASTTLYIRREYIPPVIYGLSTIHLKTGEALPDLLDGVYAEDDADGICPVTCTDDNDYSEPGVYYISYSARDKSGNLTSESRRVEVTHSSADTAAMVAEIAAELSNDPEEIRDYVRENIWYSHEWGGDDPVWYGFSTRSGNCYVHAMCLKAIYDVKGIPNRLIWVTGPEGFEKSHYWLQVLIDGHWKHIDPTPSDVHEKYSLMNDEQRYETLAYSDVYRDWDRSRWPACD